MSDLEKVVRYLVKCCVVAGVAYAVINGILFLI